ncbi:MAG: RES family NAD+ phosphorylase [Acidobacteriia bacterium]|nr:RES family NAD+ phosphorylase [Terriglobia bacterium]
MSNTGEFESYRSYRQFALSVTKRRRYARNPEQAAFLKAVLATSVARQEVIPSGSALWRAQLGHAWHPEDLGGGVVEELPAPFDVERMKPLRNRSRENRANPKGIPYLYLATDQDIAVAEVRPWIGSYVSIAQFALKRDVRVVNCVTDDHRLMMYFGEPEPEERERAVWRDIDRAFSQPVTPDDNTADYAPTQVVAEFFRENGLDGVAYGSSLGLGHNVALFDTEVAVLVNCGLRQIRGVKLDASPAANPYFVTDASVERSTSGA